MQSEFSRVPRSPRATLSAAIEQLRLSLLTTLTLKYRSEVGSGSAVLLAQCVLSYAMLEPPFSESAFRYAQAHRSLVHAAALDLSLHADVASALSYIFAARTIDVLLTTGGPSEQTEALSARAAELSITIPDAHDLCGTADAFTCIRAIEDFALAYRDKALRPRPI